MSNEAGTSKLLHLQSDFLEQETFFESLIQKEVDNDGSAKMKTAWWKRYKISFRNSLG
jgi:hypothetical protein